MNIHLVNNTLYVHVHEDGTIQDCMHTPPYLVDAYPDDLFIDEWRTPTPEELVALGWLPLTEVVAPPDTTTMTHVMEIAMVDGTPTEVWIERAKTPEEIIEDGKMAVQTQLQANPGALIDELRKAVTDLETILQLTNAELNARFQQNPAAILKDILRPTIVIGRKLVRLSRLDLKVLDSSSESM